MAEQDTTETVVIFRKYPDGEIIALFPAEREGPYVTSYVHVGQHGDASYGRVIEDTVLAAPDEYAALANELIRIGYKLKIRQRLPARGR